MFKGIVYLVVNKINGMKYVGQTIQDLCKRKNHHIYRARTGGGYFFHQALQEYGYDNFEWSIICECNSVSELEKMELHYIKYYDCVDNGYNNRYNNSCVSEEVRKKLQKSGTHSYEYIVKYVKEHGNGIKLKSKTYKNNISLLTFICPQGHTFRKSWMNFINRNCTCPTCVKIENSIKIEEVSELAKSRGYELLSKIYIRSGENLKFNCPKHGIFYMCYSSLKRGQGCQKCWYDKQRTPIEFMREESKKRGYDFLSTESITMTTKYLFKCPIHGEFRMSWHTFYIQGSGCQECALKNSRLDFNVIKETSKVNGHTVISTEYIKITIPLTFMCERGHKFSRSWAQYKINSKCPQCKIEEKFKEKGFILRSEYIDSKTPVEVECSQGHITMKTLKSIQANHGCKECVRENRRKKLDK